MSTIILLRRSVLLNEFYSLLTRNPDRFRQGIAPIATARADLRCSHCNILDISTSVASNRNLKICPSSFSKVYLPGSFRPESYAVRSRIFVLYLYLIRVAQLPESLLLFSPSRYHAKYNKIPIGAF